MDTKAVALATYHRESFNTALTDETQFHYFSLVRLHWAAAERQVFLKHAFRPFSTRECDPTHAPYQTVRPQFFVAGIQRHLS